MPTTNLKAQKRFVSSIARRLDQLGALTRGQREATGQGIFTAADNLESEYATTALITFFGDLYRGVTPLSFLDVTKQMGLNLFDHNGAFCETKIPAIPQFLNRLLSLKTDQQNAVFDEFEKRLVEAVEYAKQHGLYDSGLQTLKALNIKKTRDDVAYQDKTSGAQTRYVELDVTNALHYYDWEEITHVANNRANIKNDLSGWFVNEYGKHKGEVFFLKDIGERIDSEGHSVRRGVVYTIKKEGHRYVDNADVIHQGWHYRSVTVNGISSFQKVTLYKPIDEEEAKKLWEEQIADAPKSETKTTRMIVGVILPIWDRVEGSEKIYRLQTDDGEMLLGRVVGANSAKQTLKNLGLESDLANKSSAEIFAAVKVGSKAILSNGWEISTAKVNFENRIEIKGRSYLSEAEKRVLTEQGAFIERISWQERIFIPNNEAGLQVFERITQSKPVVDLIEKGRKQDDEQIDQLYGIPKTSTQAIIQHQSAPHQTTAKITAAKPRNDSRQEVSMTEPKKPFHEIVAENLIRQLEQGTAPWQQLWAAGEYFSLVPFNPLTGKRYKGINALHLMAQEHGDQRWMTYKQASESGGQVRKGEKGTGIQYWKFTEEHVKRDEHGKPVLDGKGNPLKVIVKLERPRVFYATVFNAEQTDGLPILQKPEQTWDAIERAEAILAASGATINHHAVGRAFYRPSSDSIYLPDKGLFESADKYYATALHELGHWTGHETRLNRDLDHPFGSEGYAKEELRAEIASLLLGDTLGIGHDPGQHAAYVGSWIKSLRDDPLEIFRAASDAEKIQSFVLSLEQKQTQELENQTEISETNEQPLVATNQNKQNLDEQAAELEKVYLQVPYQERNKAKELGAKWDRQAKAWYVPANIDTNLFSQWSKLETVSSSNRQYLAVPYDERTTAKVAGAVWDKQAKSWYVGENADIEKLNQWLPENSKIQQAPAMSVQQEFSEALASLGCLVTDEHPIMDGQTHRIATEGDKPGERAGFYVAYLDGHSAGFIQNNRTGETIKWKAKGYSLSETEKARLQSENAMKRQARESERKAKHDQVSQAVRMLLSVSPPALADHPYLQSKKAKPGNLRIVPDQAEERITHAGILIGKSQQESQQLRKSHPEKLVFTAGDLLLPAIDIHGEIRTVQTIQDNGTKRFAKGGEKQGMFHIVGGSSTEALNRVKAIVISEGYATADTLSQAQGFPPVAAFDSGNLPSVTKQLRDKFPNKPIIIAGDNDLHLELMEGRNPGKEKALEAAKLVKGKAVFPIFAPGEHTYPANFPSVESLKSKKIELSEDQKTIINKLKNFNDFNDLATKSVYGMDGVKRQILGNLIHRNDDKIDQNEIRIPFEEHKTHNKRIRI